MVGNGVDLVMQKQGDVVAAALNANLTVLLSGDIKSVVSISNSIKKKIHSYSPDLVVVEGVRFSIMGTMLVVILVGCLAMIIVRPSLRWRRWQIVLCGVINAVLWTVVGLHIALGLVASDVCYAVDETHIRSVPEIAGVKLEEIKPYLDYFMLCNGTDPFHSFLMGTHSLLGAVDKKLNESIAANRPQEEIYDLEAHIQELDMLVVRIEDLLSCTYVSHMLASIRQMLCVRVLVVNFFQLCFVAVLALLFGVGIVLATIHTIQSRHAPLRYDILADNMAML